MMGVMTLIRLWWQRRQRQIDLDILWPICLKGANDLDHAKAAFAMHCFHDPAWLALDEDELIQLIDKLGDDEKARLKHQQQLATPQEYLSRCKKPE